MHEHEEIEVHESSQRPHPLRGKIALPERVGVDLQELVPRPFAPLRAGVQSVFLQDVLYRLAADLPDSQLPKFPENARVAP